MNSIIRNFAVAASLVVPVLGQALDSTVKKPSPAVQKARRALPADQATQTPTTGLKASGGNSWFPVTVRELGTFYGSGEAIGKFDFTNPQQTDVDWVALTPSCQCARAEVLVGDGESLRTYRVISKPQKRLVRVTRAAGE
ncbi:MAG: hypothetical protein VXY92_14095, partial [Planctomycetota bacterium]|nr:hypothetical protein [Planctomycetota bacterium]